MKTNTLPLQASAFYHIYNRGVNGEDLFKEKKNYDFFLGRYVRFVSPVADTYAYCLLKNHFHFLIRTKSPEEIESFGNSLQKKINGSENHPLILSRAMSSFFKSYAQAMNKAYGRTGALFEEPFRRKEVASDAYLSQLIQYIHFNPENHGFTEDFQSYPFSSFGELLDEERTWLARTEVMARLHGKDNFLRIHQEGGRRIDFSMDFEDRPF